MANLQIWWIIGRDFGHNSGFTYDVENEFDAGMLLNALANFDNALGDGVVSSNAGGLNEWDKVDEVDDWCTYINEEGNDFDEVMKENEAADPSYYVPQSEKDFKLVCEVLAKYARYVFRV